MRKGFDNLFEYLEILDNEKSIILDIVSILNERDQEILRKKCGLNFDGIGTKELDKNEKIRLHSAIIPRIKNAYVVLHNLKSESVEYDRELKKFKSSFSKTRKVNSISNLIAYFNNLYSFEELNDVIKSLKEEEQKGIYAVCGELLNGENTKEDTLPKEERTKVNTHYLPKVKSRLKKLYPKRNAEDASIIEEPLEIKKSSNLESSLSIQTSIRNENENTYPLVENISGVTVKDNIGFTKEDYLDIVKIFNSQEFKELTRLNLPLEEVIVASLLHHGFKGKRFSIEDLEKFLGISREMIIGIAKKSTETYRSAINEKINEYEMRLEKLLANDSVEE